MQSTIVVFHNNLRLSDNRALSWAATKGAVIPLYIFEQDKNDALPLGGASRWWLREALKDLAANLKQHDVSLILRKGKPLSIIRDIIKQTDAKAVTWNRRYEPHFRKADNDLQDALNADGIETEIHDGFLLFELETIRTGGGTPFKVYTPFSRACLSASAPHRPLPIPKKLIGVKGIKSDTLDDWHLVPRKAKWPEGLNAAWQVSEGAAHKQLKRFIDKQLTEYKHERDRPDYDGTSRMSPYLHFGLISPHQIWQAIEQAHAKKDISGGSIERYQLEILWREFSWHLLHQFPELPEKPFTTQLDKVVWRKSQADLKAWQKGLTGYPIVDAGMRQLWKTGWMHNRVRMITASFLIKDLLIDWREGEAWFWDTLVDADLGNNAASWQWVAGCGADAAPFFRIFNPMLQGKKFDPDGDYVREFVPELSKLDTKWIHEPWSAPDEVLKKAGITLGETYPEPIVQHDKARERALDALGGGKGSRKKTKEKTKDLFD